MKRKHMLTVVLCMAVILLLGAKSSLLQRIENLEDVVDVANKRIDYLERTLKVESQFTGGHHTYNGGDPANVYVSGEELRRIHRQLREQESKRFRRRRLRRRSDVKRIK